jgi:large subunit ribosomal protein L35
MASNSSLRYTDLVHLVSGKSLFPKWVIVGPGQPNRVDLLKDEKTMPKLKTHTGAAKRFSKTGTGKIKRHQTKMRHILTSKLPKTKRKLGKSLIVSDADYDKVARMIPYA